MANLPGVPVWRDVGPSPCLASAGNEPVPIVIVGAGPVGLAMALDLGQRGHRIVVLNKLDFVAGGSKAICFAKRSLDIFDRLGVGDPIVDHGVAWNVGKVYWGDRQEPIYQFDMEPVKGQKRPGFVNIQQYHVEEYLLAALAKLDNVQLRWGHQLTALERHADGVRIEVDGPDDSYAMEACWLIACDGSRSTVRTLMGLDFNGRVFEDHFLIADIRMKGEFPAERRFWFDPPFNRGQSALMHKQPDDVWRLDFQLGPNIDRAQMMEPSNVERYVLAMLGDGVAFDKEWYSIYTFQCRRMEKFVHGHVLFAGDSAHLVSPFGARGCNGGLADVDNLGWKLDLVLRGEAPASLLDSYNHEAVETADENIRHSSRSTDFMTPKTTISRAFRDAVLELAKTQPFARPLVNSGRLSTAVSYRASPLSTPDSDSWEGGIAPGAPAVDAPLARQWLMEALGQGFVLLGMGWDGPLPAGVGLLDVDPASAQAEVLRERYALERGGAYLIRPDQYVAARWQRPTAALVESAYRRATGAQP